MDIQCEPVKHRFIKFDDEYVICERCGQFRRSPNADRMKVTPPVWPPYTTTPYPYPNGTGDWHPTFPYTITS